MFVLRRLTSTLSRARVARNGSLRSNAGFGFTSGTIRSITTTTSRDDIVSKIASERISANEIETDPQHSSSVMPEMVSPCEHMSSMTAEAVPMEEAMTYSPGPMNSSIEYTSEIQDQPATMVDVHITKQKDKIMQNQPGLTLEQYKLLLNLALDTDDIIKANDLLHLMKNDSLKPDIDVYNTMIGYFVQKAVNKKNGENKMKPKQVNYPYVLRGIAQPNKFSEVLHIFEVMKQDGVSANINTYNMLIFLYMNTDEFAKALEVLMMMKYHGVEPNEWTNTLFGGSRLA
jgi:pentatricopeptide repeat protein